jgi:hypothetical protein
VATAINVDGTNGAVPPQIKRWQANQVCLCTTSSTMSLTNPNTVWKRLEAAFAILHRTPALKTLKLLFKPRLREIDSDVSVIEIYYSHQFDIFAAIGSSQYPLPRLRSRSIHRWMPCPKFESLYYTARILELAESLQHLRIALHRGRLYYESEDAQF